MFLPGQRSPSSVSKGRYRRQFALPPPILTWISSLPEVTGASYQLWFRIMVLFHTLLPPQILEFHIRNKNHPPFPSSIMTLTTYCLSDFRNHLIDSPSGYLTFVSDSSLYCSEFPHTLLFIYLPTVHLLAALSSVPRGIPFLCQRTLLHVLVSSESTQITSFPLLKLGPPVILFLYPPARGLLTFPLSTHHKTRRWGEFCHFYFCTKISSPFLSSHTTFYSSSSRISLTPQLLLMH